MDTLAERNIPLASLGIREANDLTEKLAEAASPAARFSLLGGFMLDRFSLKRVPHRAVRAALVRVGSAGDDLASIADVVASSGLSHRRLIELFRREVGLTPQDFSRVRRFQRAFSLSRQRPRVSGAELAAYAGYFDQSHWSLECKKLAKVSAGSLLTLGRDATALPNEERGQMLPIRRATSDFIVTA